jgi:hypothetical protein
MLQPWQELMDELQLKKIKYSEQHQLTASDHTQKVRNIPTNMAESTSAATAPLPSSAGPSSSTKPSQALWLRCEKKPHEQRCALTPNTAKTLIDNGFEIFVEKDNVRCYADEEFEA